MRGSRLSRSKEAGEAVRCALKGEVYSSDMISCPVTGRLIMVFSAPVRRERDHLVVGAVIGYFPWAAISQVLDEIDPKWDIYLLDRAGRTIGRPGSHSDEIFTRQHGEWPELLAMKGQNGSNLASMIAEHGSEAHLAAIAFQEGFLSWTGKGWGMLVEVPLRRAFAPIRSMMRRLSLLFLLILGITTGLSYVLGGYMAGPIKALMKTAEAAGKGDLTIKAEVGTRDEIGALSETFNRMLADLDRITVSRAEMENILQTLMNSLLVITPDGTISRVNRATCELLGYQENEILGKHIGTVFEEEGILKENGIETILRYQFVRDVEKRCFARDGRKIPVLFSASVMKDPAGEVKGIVCVVQDIGELKETQAQLVQAAKLAAIGELSAGVAHELNQPLTVMRMSAQLALRSLEKGASDAGDLSKLGNVVQRNTKRMMNIINHLRHFSRMSEKTRVSVDMNRVIEECFLMIGEQLRLRDITVQKTLSPDLPRFNGDPN